MKSIFCIAKSVSVLVIELFANERLSSFLTEEVLSQILELEARFRKEFFKSSYLFFSASSISMSIKTLHSTTVVLGLLNSSSFPQAAL